ncbi:MAG: FAD/NAD(P)-binding protein [Solirubrobacteraceae bacterium]
MPELPAPFRVAERLAETHDTWTLRLEPDGAGPGEPFAPGQFAMLYAFGAGAVPVSVSGVHHGGALTHTVRSVGAVTAALCAARPGEVVGVRGPFGTAWPLAEAEGRDVVIVAGGIGLAPLRPVVRELVRRRADFGRVCVLYGGRSPYELLYTGELAEWRAADVDVEVSVDAAPAGWRGRVGVVTRAIPGAAFDPDRTVAMMCGPEVMMRFASDALRDRGVPTEAIWLSLERSMSCGTGHCGHCQLGPLLICRDGPVVRLDVAEPLVRVPEL